MQRDDFSIQDLPPHFVEEILSLSLNFNMLRNLVRTSHYMHDLFTGREKYIVTRVLVNQIGWHVLPEAIATYESSLLGPYELQKAEEFSKKHLAHRMTSLSKSMRWSLTEAAPIVRLHQIVKCLARGYMDDAEKSYSGPGPRIIPKDIYEIQRAFYRFEIYWNIFGLAPRRVKRRENQDVYFTIGEFAQVARIETYLRKPILELVMELDPRILDKIDLPIGFSKNNEGYVRFLVASGLENIHRMLTTKSIEETY
ncbi:hypothetical protein F5Y02DRAFT_373255 [Annulohypoxylon stygium]|nr:hypothetical protein F5Y02DRAFT_373255 [Annulohypoxylon stygium]